MGNVLPPIDDPLSNLHLSAGYHMLTPTQELGYVRARYTLGNGSDLERIGRQQAFMSSLVSRVKSQLLNPLAIYRFLDAATRSLTIDSELGGITGLYDLGQSLRDLPQDKIAFFTLPTFASFRDDVPASNSLFGAQPASPPADLTVGAHPKAAIAPGAAATPTAPTASGSPAASPSATARSADLQARTANQDICAG